MDEEGYVSITCTGPGSERCCIRSRTCWKHGTPKRGREEIKTKILGEIVRELQKYDRIFGLMEIVKITGHSLDKVRTGLATAQQMGLIQKAAGRYGKGFIAVKNKNEQS